MRRGAARRWTAVFGHHPQCEREASFRTKWEALCKTGVFIRISHVSALREGRDGHVVRGEGKFWVVSQDKIEWICRGGIGLREVKGGKRGLHENKPSLRLAA
jgi:hypothetical protein